VPLDAVEGGTYPEESGDRGHIYGQGNRLLAGLGVKDEQRTCDEDRNEAGRVKPPSEQWPVRRQHGGVFVGLDRGCWHRVMVRGVSVHGQAER
jgi:hypothetical protein